MLQFQAATRAARTATEAADVRALTELNQAFIRSVQESDVGRFDQILAAGFLNSNPDGTLIDRAAFLKQIAAPVGISGLRAEDVCIRLFGDMAIIHARTAYTKPDGQPGQGRYTDVWARQDERWLCVSAHVTRG